ncbi:unnamed protein product [Trifolium pratense]|uniref:Uncharacterized protein n=2 Tax=Trifolium pratense TaxID=57577 RepID=A0ACB0J551_TRIPR|nr:unnamed protein product [Trifolium pratense]
MALMRCNPTYFSSISEINSDKATWNFKAKVIRLWEVSDFNRPNNPFSIEMVLMDSEGERIHATIKKTLIYKFKDDLMEGKVYSFENMGVSTNGGAYRTTHHRYKLNFQFGSLVQRLTNVDVSGSQFNLVPISDVVSGGYDTDFLVDVIGVLTGVGSEREITNQNGSSTKLNVVALEADGHKLQCTLFGPYVDELNNFLASGDHTNAVMIVQLAKAKTFQDKIHIQNCMNCTRLFFNPNCQESIILKESLPESLESPSPMTLTQITAEPGVSPLDEFLFNSPRITLQAMKDATNESVNVVCATVKRILNPECFWYTACVCNKSVIPDSNMFFCDKCNKHVLKVIPRYCMKVRVIDQTDSATFVIFDKDASSLFQMSCADMLDDIQRVAGVGGVPSQLTSLIDKTWLFKVETKPSNNPRFEQTFKVRKICTDANIIKQFKDKWDHEEASISKLNNEVGSLSTLIGKGKDVLVCGSTNILSEDSLSLNESNSKDQGKSIICDNTPIACTQDLMCKFSSTVVDLDDPSLDTFICNKDVGDIKKSDMSSKLSIAASSLEGGGKDIVVEAVDLQKSVGTTTKEEAVGKTYSGVVHKDEFVANKNIKEEKTLAGCGEMAKGMVIEGSSVGKIQQIKGMTRSDVVNLDEDIHESGSSMVIALNQIGSTDIKAIKGKKISKRISPEKQDEDDNAPIKLLKRAIKIEKIT